MKNDNDSLEIYLNEQLTNLKKNLDQKLAVYKNGLQAQTNKIMLGYIAHAEEEIEEAKIRLTNQYRQQMENLKLQTKEWLSSLYFKITRRIH